MAVATLQGAFTAGEVAPALFGRFDLARLHVAATTMRNMFVRYQGGSSSRPGGAFVGWSKQTGRSLPPRILTFQFSINQGLLLEFGNFYMRVIQNGAYVLEAPLAITGATRSDPALLTLEAASRVTAAAANNAAVISSYAPGDLVTLAGGIALTPAVLSITTTQLEAVQLATAGTGYAVNDTITLAGGGIITAAVIKVLTVDGSGVILTFQVLTAGNYSANPAGLSFTQGATSGSGINAAFDFAVMAPNTLAVHTPGVYTVAPVNPVAQAATTGAGLGATFTLTTAAAAAFAAGDWIVIDDVVGMTELNQRTFIVANVTATTVTLQDVYGDPVDSTTFSPYIMGGTAARIYTLATPYADADLKFLKPTQSKDTMSLCLVNQETMVEYPSYDLARLANDNWVLTELESQTPVTAPTGVTVAASASGTTAYQYVVTAVDPNTGAESVASPIGEVDSAVDIAATAGTLTITWTAVPGVNQYFVYKANPGYAGAPIPGGTAFGFAGFCYGTQFTDSNIVADYTQVPPLHRDPFAPGQVLFATPIAGGTGYTDVGFTINTTTGSGAILAGVLVGGALSAITTVSQGKNYAATDTVTVTSASGTGATASLTVGPQSGTFPGVVNYFQQRRAYGYTLNQPDTYFFSQPGAYTDFDFRIPTIASDAITGNPWAVQVNGIQAFVSMPGGLIVFTGKEAYQLTGTGGSSVNPQPITPSTQQIQPQASNGCNFHILPIKIDQDVLFVQTKGSIVRNISFQYLQNIYTGADLTLTSSHLFLGHQMVDWCYAEEPFKLVYIVRDDGVLLMLTFVKPQEIAGWARADTNGAFVSVATVTEFVDNAVFLDAVYVATQRFPAGKPTYMIERLNDRLWDQVEDVWAVDAALALPQPMPNATITASSATGLGAISGITGLAGGTGYSAATTAVIVDDNGLGPGSGATLGLTIVAGAITAITVLTPGTAYTYPRIDFFDPANTGQGAAAVATLDTSASFATTAPAFAPGDLGSVIRMGGGIATITAVVSTSQVTATITQPIVDVFADDQNTPLPKPSGFWTLTAPVNQVTNLLHLAGLTVTGLYDGNVLPPVVVPANGVVPLPAPASSVVVGLQFEAQLQTPYLDVPGTTIQGQRKKIGDVTVRIEASRGLEAGSNQVDGSTLSPPQNAPVWQNMAPIEDKGRPSYGSTVIPLYTGDTRLPVIGGYNVHGQVALRQRLPLPMNLLAVIPESLPGDTPGIDDKPPQKRAA